MGYPCSYAIERHLSKGGARTRKYYEGLDGGTDATRYVIKSQEIRKDGTGKLGKQ